MIEGLDEALARSPGWCAAVLELAHAYATKNRPERVRAAEAALSEIGRRIHAAAATREGGQA